MESSGTDAPLSPEPTQCSAALLAPGVPSRSTPPCFSLPVLTGVGRGQGCCLPKAGAVSLEGHRARAGAEQGVARLRTAARGAPCPGLDAAGCQADLYLPTAAGQGSGIRMGASAPAEAASCASWGEPYLRDTHFLKLVFAWRQEVERAIARFAASSHEIPSQEGMHPQVLSGKKAGSPVGAAMRSEERCRPRRRCSCRQWGCSF